MRANRSGAQRLGGELLQGVQESGAAASKGLSDAQRALNEQIAVNDAMGSTSYTGSSSLADTQYFQSGQEAADKAARDAKRLADIYGRMGMLGERYGSTAGYGTGARAFDAALLGSTGQAGFESARAQYGKLPGQFQSALEGSAKDVEAARNRAAERAKQPREQSPVAPSPLDEFPRQPIAPEPDVSADAPWLGKRPRKKNDTPLI